MGPLTIFHCELLTSRTVFYSSLSKKIKESGGWKIYAQKNSLIEFIVFMQKNQQKEKKYARHNSSLKIHNNIIITHNPVDNNTQIKSYIVLRWQNLSKSFMVNIETTVNQMVYQLNQECLLLWTYNLWEFFYKSNTYFCTIIK